LGDVWEPGGPLPAAVYWRRRGVALASVVALVALLPSAAGAVRHPAPTAATVPPTSVADRSAGLDLDGAGVPAEALPAPGRTEAPPDTATASRPDPTTTTERLRQDDTAPDLVAAATPMPVPASGPVPCTNAMLSAAAEVDPAVHAVGSRPVLRLVITNTSRQPCVRDLDPARQEIVVWSADGRDRLWSSNDCVNASSVDLRTLVPGRPVAFSLTWAERTTTPGCARPRTPVPAGTYRLLVRLDDLISPPTPFIRT
jgi:hypothetical protein